MKKPEQWNEEERRIMNERDDVAMIKNPQLWTHYPFLPLKRGPFPDMEEGIIHTNDPTIVRKCNLLLIPRTLEEFRKLPATRYLTVEAIIGDGWLVD